MKNGILGRPGTIATAQIAPPPSCSVFLCRVNWCSRSVPRSISVAARVTMRPDESEMSSAGICATRPSPTVSRLYVLIASPNDRCCCRMPTAKPPMRLIDDDDDRRDRVALHELRGTVHRSVEVGFFGDLAAAALRLFVVDEARVQVGVDRHLLAGHRVEGEARRDLGDASGTVRDHDELDHDEDEEDDEADDHRTADDEVAERLDDLARVAVQQHEPRDRHVQREAEQRRDEEVRREDREVEDAGREHAREEREQCERDVRDEQQVEERGRQRHDHHHHDADDRGGDCDLSDAVGSSRCSGASLARRPWPLRPGPDRRASPGVDDFARLRAHFRPIRWPESAQSRTGFGSSW